MLADAIEINSKRGRIAVERIEESPRHLGVIIARASKAYNKALLYEDNELAPGHVVPGRMRD